MTSDKRPTKLRDWQKKASEKSRDLAKHEDSDGYFGFLSGYAARDSEIDLLIQIIEKQSKALDDYASEVPSETRFTETGYHLCKPAMGTKARTTQAEVQEIIEELVKE
jgi:hypothetical protein